MSRLPRYPAPGIPHHVTQRGHNRRPIFATESDYQFFRDCLVSACERHHCRVHAYAFMTNHVHLLVTPSRADGISKVMQSVGVRYAHHFNVSYARTGGLWEGRYRATVVQTDRYLFACYRYIELNPVRACLVQTPRAHPWTSHRANAFGASDPVVAPHERYFALGADPGARQAAYRGLFRAELSDSLLEEIRDATNMGWALGGDRFCDEITMLVGRRSQRLRTGPSRRSTRVSDTRPSV